MPTNNMIKPKSPKYPCFHICNVDVQIIGWICNWLMSIFQLKLIKHRDKTQNQTSYKMTNNTTPHLDDEITKTQKEKLIFVKITYLDWKKMGKERCRMMILDQKMT